MAEKEHILQTSMVIGILILVLGLIFFISSFSTKLLGIILIFAGGFLMFKVPDATDIQYQPFATAAIKIGIFLIIVGIILIIL